MMKTEKRKANVGERILITNPQLTGGYYVLNSVLSVIKSLDNVVVTEDNPRWVSHEEYEVIVAEPKPKKSARITALETQVAELQAKVEALEKAGKYPLTAQFERESPEVDAILADIERKAKPTLEALLATYPKVEKTQNEKRAALIHRAKTSVDGHVFGASIQGADIKFVVNAEKRTVVALLYHKSTGEFVRRAIAKCDPDDVFNADIGKAIAIYHVYGAQDVPERFLKAVQPTEVVVGHIVKYVGNAPGRYGEVFKVCPPGVYARRGDKCAIDSAAARNAVITDDTDAVYE